MSNSIHDDQGTARELSLADLDDAGLTSDVASFVNRPGVGRVLCIGGEVTHSIEEQLADAHYHVGHLSDALDRQSLTNAAATFLPDVLYVVLADELESTLDALEALSDDPRTKNLPILALIPSETPATMVEELYSRAGCDFFRLGQTRVELLARTHLLIRLVKDRHPSQTGYRPSLVPASAANDPAAGRIDLRDGTHGLFSAEYFFHRLPTEVSRARRYGRCFSVMAIRCPQAKTDDEAAHGLAELLRRHLRDSDISARVEPDVFLILLPEVSADALDSLERRLEADLQRNNLHVGFGRAGLDGIHRSTSPQDLLDRARAIANAKFGG
jgi:GGDEF domain-containing protein